MKSPFRSQYRITQEFGVNYDYYKQFGFKGHEGVDLVPTGTSWDILCLADGIVVRDEDNPASGAYGVYQTVWHPTLRKATQYCHFKENYFQNGDAVKVGQKLGLMGKTGNTTGAHLHLNLFETDENGIRLNKGNGYNGGIDPIPFMESLTDEAPPAGEFIQVEKSKFDDFERVKSIYNEARVKLNVEDSGTVFLAEIDKLIGYEDAVVQKDKQLQETQSELAEVKMKLGLLTDSHNALQTSYDTLQGQLTTDKNTITTLKTRIEEMEKTILAPVRKGWRAFLVRLIDKNLRR